MLRAQIRDVIGGRHEIGDDVDAHGRDDERDRAEDDDKGITDLLDDQASVVDRAVVGALLDHGDPERPRAPPRFLVGDQRMAADLGADRRLVECLVEDRADQPVGVAVGLEIDRDAAADEQRAVMGRLVVVAVEQHEVAFGHQRGEHDLVG